MTVNNVYGVMKAVQSGAGVGALPEFMAASNPDLVQVLPELTGPQLDAYFVYAEEMRRSKRISVFRDFLLRKVAESNFCQGFPDTAVASFGCIGITRQFI